MWACGMGVISLVWRGGRRFFRGGDVWDDFGCFLDGEDREGIGKGIIGEGIVCVKGWRSLFGGYIFVFGRYEG